MTKLATKSPTAFQLKGSLFTLSILKLQSSDIKLINNQLEQTIKRAPAFFNHAPFVIDLSEISQDAANNQIDFSSLVTCLRKHNLVPTGVRCGNELQHGSAIDAGLAVFPDGRENEVQANNCNQPAQSSTEITSDSNTAINEITDSLRKKSHINNKIDEQQRQLAGDDTSARQDVAAKISPSNIALTATKVITEPVRSGKQIYAQGGDLLILSSVNHGAEVLADGNIFIFGPLYGRALAGIRGDKTRRIFCNALDAELISIAGHYKVNEDLQSHKADGMTHIYLEDDELNVTVS